MGIRYSEWTDEGGLYYFDERAASRACAWLEKFLILFEGEWAGKPLVLMDWQRTVIRNVFGWKRTKDGTRRCRTCYVWIPRKNAKSVTAAGVGLLLLYGDAEPAAQIYCLASTEDQARIVFDFCGHLIAGSPELSRHVTPFKTAIWLDSLKARIQPLTGKPAGKHGLNAHGILGDEIHEWPNNDLYTFVRQSQGTRRQPLNFLISTAGQRDTTGYEHYRLCEAILNGEIHAPETFVFIAAADAQRDQDDPLYWTTDEAIADANPGLGSTVKLDFIQSEIANALAQPSAVNDVKRYLLNLWVDQAVLWIPMDKWDLCGFKDNPQPERVLNVLGYVDDKHEFQTKIEEVEFKRDTLPTLYAKSNMRWREFTRLFKGRRCLVGIDLSSTTDLTAVVYIFPPDDNFPYWAVIPRFFLPLGDTKKSIKKRIEVDKFDYLAAESIGALTLTDGPVVDYDIVFNDFRAHAEVFDVAGVAIDRWNATAMATRIMELEGFAEKVALFGQGFASMSGPAKFLERKILQKQFDHGGHPLLRWNMRNTAVKKDAAENLKPVKDESTGRIDGVIGTIMGIGISDEFRNDGPSVYETRGVLSV